MERARVIIFGEAAILSASLILVAAIPFSAIVSVPVSIVVVTLMTVVSVGAFLRSPSLVAYSLIGLFIVIIVTVTSPTVTIAPGAAIASKRPWCSF